MEARAGYPEPGRALPLIRGRNLTLLTKECFLFDLDGTLVDSNSLHAEAFREVLASGSADVARRFDYGAVKGRPTGDVFEDLGFERGPELDAIVADKRERYRRAVAAGRLALMPGAAALLAFLAAKGRRLFVVTGGTRASATAALRSTGIASAMEGVVTGDDVPRGKPHPDVFEHCLRRFALERPRCVVVEDAASGISAARRAGLDVIAVHDADRDPPATWRFDTLDDLHRRLRATTPEEVPR